MKPIYLIDTNILCQWLTAYMPSFQQDNPHFRLVSANKIRQLIEGGDYRIYVPDVVWAEFLGVTLHKNMDVSADFEQFQFWLFRYQSYIKQMQGFIIRQHQFFQWPDTKKSPHVLAANLSDDAQLVNLPTFQWLKNKSEHYAGQIKLLDGMDATILIYLDALAQLHPQRIITLYTADKALAQILARVKVRHSDWFAQNTAASYALK
ncbi:hypothetical protein CKO12_08875 [Chromatium okenii]|uniref:hypothetical protein n=1 Tax=Chromatium okenii TaxID=61644 RepID=UPI001908BF59|nr:hypothetical protein [Chromatium okenii]MBK1641981.1 hypothetical protein [Chromatium okenii]